MQKKGRIRKEILKEKGGTREKNEREIGLGSEMGVGDEQDECLYDDGQI